MRGLCRYRSNLLAKPTLLFHKEKNMTTKEDFLFETPWSEDEEQSVAKFFHTNSKELSLFLSSHGVDKKALLDALNANKASDFVKAIVNTLELEDVASQEKARARAHDEMSRLSRALRVAAREHGALSDFEKVFESNR